MSLPEIIPYDPSLKSYFKTINIEWLNKYFFVTEEDGRIISNPEKIINDGGCIFFARFNNEIIGTCALIKESEDEFELAKMGVREDARRNKAGQLLLQACIDEAKRRGAKIISLDTAYRLEPAIALYTKFGFVKTADERTHPVFKRATFRMELML